MDGRPRLDQVRARRQVHRPSQSGCWLGNLADGAGRHAPARGKHVVSTVARGSEGR